MSERKHTPGPWVWDPGYCYHNLRAPDRVDVLEVIHYDDGIRAVKPADAALIAAAPDLLEALKTIADESSEDPWHSSAAYLRKVARAAIAKAEARDE